MFVLYFAASGRCIGVNGLQLPGVIDNMFSYTGPLGAIFSDENVSFYLCAPTAQVNVLFKVILTYAFI